MFRHTKNSIRTTDNFNNANLSNYKWQDEITESYVEL